MKLEYRYLVRFVPVNHDLLLDDCAIFGVAEPTCIDCGAQVEWRDAKYNDVICANHHAERVEEAEG